MFSIFTRPAKKPDEPKVLKAGYTYKIVVADVAAYSAGYREDFDLLDRLSPPRLRTETVGRAFSIRDLIINNEAARLHFWKVSVSPDYRMMLRSFYLCANAVIFSVQLSSEYSKKTFKEICKIALDQVGNTVIAVVFLPEPKENFHTDPAEAVRSFEEDFRTEFPGIDLMLAPFKPADKLGSYEQAIIDEMLMALIQGLIASSKELDRYKAAERALAPSISSVEKSRVSAAMKTPDHVKSSELTPVKPARASSAPSALTQATDRTMVATNPVIARGRTMERDTAKRLRSVSPIATICAAISARSTRTAPVLPNSSASKAEPIVVPRAISYQEFAAITMMGNSLDLNDLLRHSTSLYYVQVRGEDKHPELVSSFNHYNADYYSFRRDASIPPSTNINGINFLDIYVGRAQELATNSEIVDAMPRVDSEGLKPNNDNKCDITLPIFESFKDPLLVRSLGMYHQEFRHRSMYLLTHPFLLSAETAKYTPIFLQYSYNVRRAGLDIVADSTTIMLGVKNNENNTFHRLNVVSTARYQFFPANLTDASVARPQEGDYWQHMNTTFIGEEAELKKANDLIYGRITASAYDVDPGDSREFRWGLLKTLSAVLVQDRSLQDLDREALENKVTSHAHKVFVHYLDTFGMRSEKLATLLAKYFYELLFNPALKLDHVSRRMNFLGEDIDSVFNAASTEKLEERLNNRLQCLNYLAGLQDNHTDGSALSAAVLNKSQELASQPGIGYLQVLQAFQLFQQIYGKENAVANARMFTVISTAELVDISSLREYLKEQFLSGANSQAGMDLEFTFQTKKQLAASTSSAMPFAGVTSMRAASNLVSQQVAQAV